MTESGPLYGWRPDDGRTDKHGQVIEDREYRNDEGKAQLDTIKAGNFNLDFKNPHNPDTGPGDVDHLLPEYEKLLAQIAGTRGQLKAQLMEALTT